MNKYLSIVLVFFVIGLVSQVHAQIYKEGSVITLNNDTIPGLIKDVSALRNIKQCKFKRDKNEEVVKYNPDEIQGYFFTNDKRYHAQRIFHKGEFKSNFVEVLLEGKINLYHFRKSSDIAFYIQKDGGDIIGLENEEFQIGEPSSNGIPIYWREFNVAFRIYKDTLEVLFEDSKEIKKQIRYLDYNDKSMLNLSKEYVKLTCSGTNCITYERNLKLSKPSFGIQTGVQFSKLLLVEQNIETDYTLNVPVGVFYYLPLSAWLEGLSIQPELTLNIIRFKDALPNFPTSVYNSSIDYNRVAIPIIVGYQLPQKKVSPFINIGREFGFVFNSSLDYTEDKVDANGVSYSEKISKPIGNPHRKIWLMELGVNYKTKKNHSLFASLRYTRSFEYSLFTNSGDNVNIYKDHIKEYDLDKLWFRFGMRF